jgi:UDP-N-acetylmuramyl pentapeptide phosphotransferase/UDP-N-acetylglucosamine-1-phosphate transferase
LRKGGSIIGGTITTIAIIGSGVLVGLIIFAFASYITFLPLFKTIRGGLQVLKERREQRVKTAINEGYDSIADTQLGLTMADGGDSVEEKVSVDER